MPDERIRTASAASTLSFDNGGDAPTIAERVVSAFEAHGVEFLFGMDDPQPLFAAARESSVRPIIIHDERSGAFMADGYTRASRRVSICSGVTGPGATNLLTGLLEAYCASVPIVVFIGEARLDGRNPHVFQEAPHEPLFAPLTKRIVRLDQADEAERAVTKSVRAATSHRQRPVLLLAGEEFLWARAEPSRPELRASVSGPASTPSFPAEAETQVAQAAELLRHARRPVVLAGGGAVSSGATDELRVLVEKLQLPVATSLFGKGAIEETHPLALGVVGSYNGGIGGIGRVGNETVAAADVVLVLGSDLDPITTDGGQWPRDGAALIRVDIDPDEVGTFDGLCVLADARVFLQRLNSIVGTVDRDEAYLEWLAERLAATASCRTNGQTRLSGSTSKGTVWPGRVVQAIERRLRPGDLVVTDASYSSVWALDGFRLGWAGQSVLTPRGCGVLGWGLPAALGAKLARPANRVTCITGDGGLYFSVAEFETAIRENISIIVIVLNNRSFAFQRHTDIVRQGNDYADLNFTDVDFADVARSFGWAAVSVTNDREFEEAYHGACSRDEPFLIDVAVDPDAKPPVSRFDRLEQRVGDH